MHNEAVLYHYLREEIFPQLSPPPYGDIEIRRLVPEKPVFLFVERDKRLLAVGKSFQYGKVPLEKAWLSADREYTNLKTVRNRFGMNGDSCEIVFPLGENKELAALLVTQKASGKPLDHYIKKAVYEQERQKLFQTLGCLARFFAKLHKNSQTAAIVSSVPVQDYFESKLRFLRKILISRSDVCRLEKLAAPWWNKPVICGKDAEVTVHGDATPTNFFIYHRKVTGIDLEKMRNADRCWDLGFIAAELKHHFLWRIGDKWAAEPFIGHFLWEYALAWGDTRFFYTITGKLPLYMALDYLRMARNTWLGEDYRKELVKEAGLCLQYGL